MKNNKAVVVVFAHNPELSRDEWISLTQCHRILGLHQVRLMCPQGMDGTAYLKAAPCLSIDAVDPAYFSSLNAYNALKTSRFLYDYYSRYEYLLTYELDSFVFRDELLAWCERGWSWLGAPWFEGFHRADSTSKLLRGGNSGFSLRHIPSCSRVLRSNRFAFSPSEVLEKLKKEQGLSPYSSLQLLRRLYRARFCEFTKGYLGNEDVFWSRFVPRRLKDFTVAPYEVARDFSFEMLPERLFSETGGRLPFGCHKWKEVGLAFWKPHIEAYGYSICG